MPASTRTDKHGASCQMSVIRKAFGEMKLKWSELKGVKLSVLSNNSHLLEEHITRRGGGKALQAGYQAQVTFRCCLTLQAQAR